MSQATKHIGYARVSTQDQDLSLQVEALVKWGIPENSIIREKASGGTMNRPEWNRIMAGARAGQVIVVWKFDRLGRTLSGMIQTAEYLREHNIGLISLTEGIDTTTAIGKFFFHIIASLAQFERDLISERTSAGMANKRAQGVRFGRKPLISGHPERIEAYEFLLENGAVQTGDDDLTAREITDYLNWAAPKAPKINHPNTYRNWVKAGYPGIVSGEADEIPDGET